LLPRFLKTAKRLRKCKGQEKEIHKFRVHSRRLAMYAHLIPGLEKKPEWKKLLKKTRELRKRLGGIREIDVHRSLWKDLAEGSRVRQALERYFTQERKDDLKKILTKVDFKEIGKEALARLEKTGVVEEKKPSMAKLRKRFEKVFRAQRRYKNKRRLDDLHQVRIALKKLRYTLEPLQEQMGQESVKLISQLKQMQDELGRVHDLATLRNELNRLKLGRSDAKRLPVDDLQKVSAKIRTAIEAGKKAWQAAWEGHEIQLRALMQEVGASAPSKKASS